MCTHTHTHTHTRTRTHTHTHTHTQTHTHIYIKIYVYIVMLTKVYVTFQFIQIRTREAYWRTALFTTSGSSYNIFSAYPTASLNITHDEWMHRPSVVYCKKCSV